MNISYLLHAYFVQGTVLNVSHMLNRLILVTPYEVSAIIVILQLEETETLRQVRSGRAGI